MNNKRSVNPLLHALLPLVIVIAYVIIGFLFDSGWAIGWILFFLIPIIETLVSAIINKNPSYFAYPVLVTAIFLFTGMMWGWWHPMWVLFLTIPAYYAICDAIKKSKPQQSAQYQPNDAQNINQPNQAQQQSTYYNPPVNVPYQQPKNNTTAIIISIIVSIAVVAIVAIVCTFSWLSGNFNIPEINRSKSDVTESYVKGPYNVPTDGIDSIDVEWVNGNINVEYYDGDTIYIEESSSNDEYPMEYKVEDKTLVINEFTYDVSTVFSNKFKKDLTVKIPESFVTEEFSMDVVSSNVNISDLNTFAFELNSVSASVNVSFAAQPSDIDMDTVSGNIHLVFPSDITGFFISSESVSGNINTNDFGNVTKYGDGHTRISLDSVSGDLFVEKAD